MADTRSIKTKQITMLSHATTTNLKVTTSVLSSAIDLTGYKTGVFVTVVTANATGDPAIYLDGSVDDGTTYVQYATLHPDMTTTANNYITTKGNLPDTVRVRVQPFTTSSDMRFNVKAEVFAK